MMEYLSALVDFFLTGIYDFVVDVVGYWVQMSVKASLYLALQTFQFSWDIAQSILSDLNITQTLNEAWGTLDNQSLNTANFFQFPQAVANVVTAYVTKFVFKFIGGSALLG